LKTPLGRADLLEWRPDVLVVVAYGLILPQAVLTLPRLGCVNIHASLLPRWRGAAPIQRALLAGDSETGVSIMLMDVGLDTGPVLLERRVPITPEDTGGSLHDRLADLGATALIEALDGFVAGTIEPRPQPPEGVTYAAKIDKAEALIDWRRNALDIERQVRAFNPWPVAETQLEGEQLRIHAARAASSDSAVVASAGGRAPLASEPGQIVGLAHEALLVACGQGLLAVTRLQRPGRRPIAARDFANSVVLPGRRLG
jgi:methionyl-tRNA formyltransferase